MGMPGNGVNNRVLADIGDIVHITSGYWFCQGLLDFGKQRKFVLKLYHGTRQKTSETDWCYIKRTNI